MDTERIYHGLESTVSDGPRFFQSTAWSKIQDAQTTDEEERRTALDRLISVYWRPVYWTIRLDWKVEPHEAKDLTQEYFTQFLESKLVDGLDPSKGRFRAFVKVTIKHFLLGRRRAQQARKRGGGRSILPLQDLDRVEAEGAGCDDPPDKRFERDLMRTIIHQALQDLEEECSAGGRKERFALFQRYYFRQSAEPPDRYGDLAREFGIGMHVVKNRLSEMRGRFREHVLGYLRDGVRSKEELLSEIREVFDA